MNKRIDWWALSHFVSVGLISLVLFGCGDKRVKVDPNDPVQKYKEDFLSKYGFFVTDRENISYYQNALGVVGKESEIFKGLKTIEDVDKFTEVFFKVRDPNPNTPENELKDTVDQRVLDIKNEIFVADIDIPNTRFSSNGGLKSDLAHVYLLYGTPGYKAKLREGLTYSELMVWYYFDVRGRPLFRFLFYNNYGSVRLFKKHTPIYNLDQMMDPLMSPLKEISSRMANTPEELYQIWQELERDDVEWAFRSALLQFSYYEDVHIEDSLKAPEPAALVAARFRPTILGQPGDLTGREFINNPYNSFIPAEFRISKDNRPSFTLGMDYSAIDWEIKGENGEFFLDIRISFQNKATRSIKEFLVRISKVKPRKEIEEKRGDDSKGIKGVFMTILLDDSENYFKKEVPRQTLRQLINSLEPGTYVVNVDLRDPITKKSAGGWLEEIVIK